MTNKPTDPPIVLTERTLQLEIETVRAPGSIPKTTNSTYGWDTVPLRRVLDRRFFHPKLVTEITKEYGLALNPKESNKEKDKQKAAAS